MDLISIREEVELNKQRAIQFAYTGEVVDFLLASIDTLTKENINSKGVPYKTLSANADDLIVTLLEKIDYLESPEGISAERLCNDIGLITALATSENENITLTKENEEASREAEHLCMTIYQRKFKDVSPSFELCYSTAGVISQIDNMVAGMLEENTALTKKVEVLREVIVESLSWVEADYRDTITDDCLGSMVLIRQHTLWNLQQAITEKE